MHQSNHVIIAPGPLESEAAHPLVAAAMAPFDESLQIEKVIDPEYGDYWDNPDSFWDWWQIGGRWTGTLVPGYDPHNDPANQETCDLCNGTGTRPDGIERFGEEWAKGCNGCNGCNGEGTRATWPTQWESHGDVTTVEALLELLDAGHEGASPYGVVMDGAYHEVGIGWGVRDPDENAALAAKARADYADLLRAAVNYGRISPDHRVVVVDSHS